MRKQTLSNAKERIKESAPRLELFRNKINALTLRHPVVCEIQRISLHFSYSTIQIQFGWDGDNNGHSLCWSRVRTWPLVEREEEGVCVHKRFKNRSTINGDYSYVHDDMQLIQRKKHSKNSNVGWPSDAL